MPPETLQGFRRFRARTEPYAGLVSALSLSATYAGWVLLSRVVVLTLMTYFLVTAHSGLRLEDISDAFGSNEVGIAGFSALAFVLLLRRLSPLKDDAEGPAFAAGPFEALFIPGFLRGSILAWAIALAFLLTGYYKYLGFYIQFEESFVVLASVTLRIAALGCMIYCEEYLFRRKILNHALKHLHPAAAAAATAVVYCVIKALQFDLGVMHLSTLFLFSFWAGLRAAKTGDFLYSAGFWAALLILFHPLLGLPVFGSSFPGVLMIKYQGMGLDTGGGLLQLFQEDADSRTLLFLTGGVGGPLSSFALQFVLILQVASSLLKLRKRPG